MYKLYVRNNKKTYEIKVFDYEMTKWAVTISGTIFRTFSDVMLIKSKIIKEINDSNISVEILEI